MDEVGRDVAHRHHHESALVHPRVRDLERRGVGDEIAVHQQIEIEGPRTPVNDALALAGRLEPMEQREDVGGVEGGLGQDGRVEVRALMLGTADRRRLVERSTVTISMPSLSRSPGQAGAEVLRRSPRFEPSAIRQRVTMVTRRRSRRGGVRSPRRRPRPQRRCRASGPSRPPIVRARCAGRTERRPPPRSRPARRARRSRLGPR